MSKLKKLSAEVSKYIVHRKKINPDISCRGLVEDVNQRFHVKLSKSSINNMLKKAQLSSPVGRRVTKIFRPAGETDGAGYAFLLGANYLMGLSHMLASCIKKTIPTLKMKEDTLETISEAWLMSKAIYNAPLEKIEEYHKNEIWFLIGRKASKGLLRQYIESLKYLQLLDFKLVSELSHFFQDVHYLRVTLADSSEYFLDGQFQSVWKEPKIPLNFCSTIDLSNSYINNVFFGTEPLIIFCALPEHMLGEELSHFIFSLDGYTSSKRIRKIELVSPKGVPVKESPFIVPGRRRFMIGIWPWHYKMISDLEKRQAKGKVFLEAAKSDFYFVEENVRFSQHLDNNEVILRLIVLKPNEQGPALLGIFTNLEEEEWTAERVVEKYVRRFPDPATGHRLLVKAAREPQYLEEFISAEQILARVSRIKECRDPESLLSMLVDLLNDFSKKVFFPPACAGWSLFKMRELFYKKRGLVQRDLADDIIFNLIYGNELQEKEIIDFAATKFNQAPLFDSSGRKAWLAVLS